LAEWGVCGQAARKEPTPMLAQNQPYSRMKHALLSAYGSKWSQRFLVMSTLYIDDSGTSPNQPIAIAAGVIIPAHRLELFEREWNRFLEKYGIVEDGLHASICFSKNADSAFADWTNDRVADAFKRARRLLRKHVVKGFCIAIHKKDYEEIVPPEMRAGIGAADYVWAVSSLLGLGYDWSVKHSAPMEYVFDTIDDKKIRRDIAEAIDYSSEPHMGYGDHFTNHHMFRARKEVPGLQLADFFAWHSYQAAWQSVTKRPMPKLVAETWLRLSAQISDDKNAGTKYIVQRLNREALAAWVKRTYGSPGELAVREYKQKLKQARMPKRKRDLSK
jgi:hypothetical protein